MILCVVKGTDSEASDHATLRGIAWSPGLPRPDKRDAIGYVPDGMLSSVIAWMVEPRTIVAGEGYPVGTLLWYQVPEWMQKTSFSACQTSGNVVHSPA